MKYNLSSLSAPSLSGIPLVLFYYFIKYFGKILGISYKLFTDSNLHLLRSKPLNSAPTMYPTPPLTASSKAIKSLETAKLLETDQRKAYLSGSQTPLQAAQRFLKNANRLNAMIKFDEKEILKQAIESTERYSRDASLSDLDGVLISIKDELDIIGYTTSLGTSFIKIEPERDAECVERLKKAGAVIIGKANMHEVWQV